MARTIARSGVLSLGVLAALSLTACAGLGMGEERDGIAISGVDGATVVTADELERTSGSVLQAIQGKIPNMKVDASPQRCPAITLRASKRFTGTNYPDVYLDGTRAQNTCILETLSAQDVDRVEVYPMGFTTRPGYGNSGHGLILLFSRRY